MIRAEPFVGRGRAVRWLVDALVRSPLVIVWGDGGLGKSTLVRHVLLGRPDAERSVWVSFRGADPEEPALLDVARALLAAGAPCPVDWDALLQSPEALRDFVLDLAARRGGPVVLDDAHHLVAEQAFALTRALAAHTTATRFVITTRARPTDSPPVPALELGRLGRRDLGALVRSMAGAVSKTTVRSLVERAAGSPWRVRQLALGNDVPDLGATPSWPERGALTRLAWLDVPLPRDLVVEVVPELAGRVAEAAQPGGSVLSDLERGGLLEATGDRVRLHELSREAILPAPPSRPEVIRIARLLLARPEHDLALRGVQIALDADDLERVTRALDARGNELLVAGFAVRLWSVLEHRSIAPLERWRHRAALAIGDARALAALVEPTCPDIELAELWTGVLTARGTPGAARDYATSMLTRFEGGAESALVRLRIARAIAMANAGDLSDALDALEIVVVHDPELRARRDGMLASLLALHDRWDEAIATASAARSVVADLAWPARADAGEKVATAIYLTGRLHEASRLLDVIAAGDDHGSARLDLGRRLRFLRARIDIDRGALGRARTEIARIEPWVRSTALLRPYLALAAGHIGLAAGDIPSATAAADALALVNPVFGITDETALFELRLGMLRRVAPPADCPIAGSSLFARLAATCHVEALLRAGCLAPPVAIERLAAEPAHPELAIAQRSARAMAWLLSDEPARSLPEIDSALRIARDTGFGVREADLLAIRADALILLGRLAALTPVAAELHALARSQPADRLDHAARWLGAVAGPRLADPGTLEALAADATVAPDVCGRARRLLGSPARGDRLDDRVVQALSARPGWSAPRSLCNGEGAPWGLDVERRRTWLEDGRYVEMRTQPTQWRLLEVLVAHGGGASKEEIALEVWHERQYHPLHHDNRLHALVRKLRVRLDLNAELQSKIATTGEGYALGGTVRVLDPRDDGGSAGG